MELWSCIVSSVAADPSAISGHVRQAAGQPIAGAQVALFDVSDLAAGAVAQATTDAAGHFVLARKALGGSGRPAGFALGPNYPNPFNPSTIIPYQLPGATPVRLEVFNVLGQHVKTLVDGHRLAGAHAAVWDATDATGQAVGAGVYFYRLSSRSAQWTRKMVLVDGQAGVATGGPGWTAAARPVAADAPVYGLTVLGKGLVPYVNPAFRVEEGMGPVEVVLAAPARAKRLQEEDLLGDVDGNGRVDIIDALIIASLSTVHGLDPSRIDIEDPSFTISVGDLDGDGVEDQAYVASLIALGDVNGDGTINLTDAYLIGVYSVNPSDPRLPAGIGERVSSVSGGGITAECAALTTHPEGDGLPAWSPDGRHLAFISHRDGNWDVYVMDADGTNARRLTNHPEFDGSPAWSPDGRHIAFESERDGNWDVYVMDADGTNARRLTNHPEFDGYPAWSPDGRHIAFHSYRDGNRDVYVMDADGTNARRLTNHPGADGYPAWSPDGRHIAFHSYRDGNRDVYVMDADGTNARRLTNHPGADGYPAWSPDGRHLAFTSERDGNRDVYVMDASGNCSNGGGDGGGGGGSDDHSNTRSSATSLSVGGSRSGRLETGGDVDYFRVQISRAGILTVYTTGSTDTYGTLQNSSGSTLGSNDDGGSWTNFSIARSVSAGTYYIRVRGYVSSTTGSYTVHAHFQSSGGGDGTNARRLTDHPEADWAPAWSPDGRHIAFSSYRDGNIDVYVMDADGTNARRLTNHPEFDGVPAWSPDGRHLAFASYRDGNWDVYVMDADGTNARRLTNHPEDDRLPAWSPDGRHIAFESERDGNWDVYVMDADGTNARRLTNHPEFDGFSAWSPDGRHIAFDSRRDGNWNVYVMDADGANTRQLTNHPEFDGFSAWSPDGRHIAFTSERDGNIDVYVMDADGANTRQLTNPPGHDGFSAWSPDGRHLAFASTRDGNWDVYVMGVSPDLVVESPSVNDSTPSPVSGAARRGF